MSQFQPTRRGLARRWLRLAPKVSAPTTAATAIVRPAKLLTTGTARAALPRSNASRAPETAAGERPARAATFAMRARTAVSRPPVRVVVLARRHTDIADAATTKR